MNAAELERRARLLRIDILGADVRRAFAERGVETILLKGPSWSFRLYEASEVREYSDVDLMVSPAGAREAEAALRQLGFVDALFEDRRPRPARTRMARWHPGAHIESWVHPTTHLNLDLHTRFRGSWAPREVGWKTLRANTETLDVGGEPTLILNAAGTALLAATHCAQHDGSASTLADLDRASQRLPLAAWRAAAEIARAVDAELAFHHGLRISPTTENLADALGVPSAMELGPNLVLGDGGSGEELFTWLRATPERAERLRLIAATIFPPPYIMRLYHVPVSTGRAGLAAAYARRPYVMARKWLLQRGYERVRHPEQRGPDWLVLGQETWGDVSRRNQLLFEEIARSSPDVRVLFVEIALRPSELRAWRRPTRRPVAKNIDAARPIRPLPARARRIADRIEAFQVRWLARRAGLRDPVVWTQDPHAADVLEHLPATRLVYDLTDDWPAFEVDAGRRAAVQDQVDWLLRRAEVIFACSSTLVDGARGRGVRAELLPNAVSEHAETTPDPVIHGLRAPRVGYVGTLHAARLDVALLERVAARHPDWSIVLVGPNQLADTETARLEALPNVHLLGARPQARVASALAALDVAMIPHVVNDFTRSLDPLKIYEYLSAGLPVVSTPVALPDHLAPLVAVRDDPETFASGLEQVLAGDAPVVRSERRAAVSKDTWTARATQVLERLAHSERQPGVSAVIVSFNTRELLDRCLEALTAQSLQPVRVIVVDNDSDDGSVEMVRERHPSVEVVELEANVGFGPANNVGLGMVETEYVLLLNSDAFLEPESVEHLVAAARGHPEAAAVGPRLLNPDGTRQRSAWPFPSGRRKLLESVGLHRVLRRTPLLEDLGTWDHLEERHVDFLSGACLLLRTDVVENVGGFDEAFYLYEEETDLQRRMTDRGWRVLFTPATSVTHVGSASSEDSEVRTRHFYSGQRQYLTKHRGRASWPVAWVGLVLGAALRGRWQVLRVAREIRPRRRRS